MTEWDLEKAVKWLNTKAGKKLQKELSDGYSRGR